MAYSHEQVLLRRVSFSRRRQIFRQSPRIAVLLQSVNDIIGNAVAFFLSNRGSFYFSRKICTGRCVTAPALGQRSTS
jgi:hypothetical protein